VTLYGEEQILNLTILYVS